MAVTAAEKRSAFRTLHEDGCFVLPNPWDIGTARMLQQVRFSALASTSSGYAWTIGKPDYVVTRDEVLNHLAALNNAVDLPINADFEAGFATNPEGVAANVDRIRRDTARIGPSTVALCDLILEQRLHPEQGFRACLGIVRLASGPAMLGLAHCAGRLHPAERRFDPLAHALACDIAGMAGRPAVDARAALRGDALRDVRRRVELAQRCDECRRVLVGTDGDAVTIDADRDALLVSKRRLRMPLD